MQCLVFATWIKPRQPPQDIAATADLLQKLSLRVRGEQGLAPLISDVKTELHLLFRLRMTPLHRQSSYNHANLASEFACRH